MERPARSVQGSLIVAKLAREKSTTSAGPCQILSIRHKYSIRTAQYQLLFQIEPRVSFGGVDVNDCIIQN